jgi:hypothetical protein
MAQRRWSLVSRIRYTAYNPDHMAIYISHLNKKNSRNPGVRIRGRIQEHSDMPSLIALASPLDL